MAKKPQFELNDLPVANENMPVTRGDIDPVFQEISNHMTGLKQAVNTQAIVLGALMKVLVTHDYLKQEEIDDAMKEIHESMQIAMKSQESVN